MPAEKLDYEVKIDTKSACERHITVTIPHEEVERYFGNAFSELMPKAAIPGFRPAVRRASWSRLASART